MKRALYLILAMVLAMVTIVSLAGLVLANQTISVKQASLNDVQNGFNDIIGWQFIINQIDIESNAPATIHITWDVGAPEDVPLSKFTGGAAHYITNANPNHKVTDATASIYDGWGAQGNGQFVLSDITRPTPPVPELSAGILLGLGLLGVGGFVLFKRMRLNRGRV